MFEFFSISPKQEIADKPKEPWAPFTRVQDFFNGLRGPRTQDIQPKKEKERVSPEIIEFNQEQIHAAMEKIHEKLKKTKKQKGIIACEELTQKDKNGLEETFALRYTVDEDTRVNDSSYDSRVMSFRIEMFKGTKEQADSIQPCFMTKEGLVAERSKDTEKHKNSPVAYRQIYFHRLAQIDPVKDGLTLQGFSFTSKEHRGLGVATKILEEVHTDELIRDFVKRTRHSWPKHRLSEDITTASCIFTDTSYLYGGNAFWTTRLMERLGMERADQNTYQYSRNKDIFVKKVSLE